MNGASPSPTIVGAKPPTSYVAGRDLKSGSIVRAISTGDGVVLDDGTYLLVTDATDRKGNRQLVNTGTGTVAYASAGSIWQLL